MRLYEIGQNILIFVFIFNLAIVLASAMFPQITLESNSKLINTIQQTTTTMQNADASDTTTLFLTLFNYLKLILYNLATANYYVLKGLGLPSAFIFVFVAITYFSYMFLLMKFIMPRFTM